MQLEAFLSFAVEVVSILLFFVLAYLEFYTGKYAAGYHSNREDAVAPFKLAAHEADKLGLGLNAGHDLNLDNLPLFAQLPGLLEVSIGHAFTVDCIRMGLANTVAAYNRCLAGMALP